MSQSNDTRVDRMFGGDRLAALLALLVLWATYAFVFLEIVPLAGGNEVLYVLAAGAGLVLLFNTASIVAMNCSPVTASPGNPKVSQAPKFARCLRSHAY